MKTDGVVIIGTELDTKDLEKQIQQSEKLLQKFDKDSEKLTSKKLKLELDISDTEKQLDQVGGKMELFRIKLNKQQNIVKELQGASLWEQIEGNYEKNLEKLNKMTLAFDALEYKHEQLLDKLDYQKGEYDNINQKILENASAYEHFTKEIENAQELQEYLSHIDFDTKNADVLLMQIKNVKAEYDELVSKDIIDKDDVEDIQMIKQELIDAVALFEKLSGKKLEIKGITDIKQVSTEMPKINTGLDSVISKVARWGLAVFSVRGAYSLVRQAVSTLSASNKQIGSDVEYIRFAIASALQPVIERIINLAYTLLQYINYIAKAWFGVNLFANATTKAFQKQNKAMGRTAKKAKELQKTLAGFDEMNILQKNGDVNSGGGGGGVPTTDLADFGKIEVPAWLKWIGDNKEMILGFFRELATLIAGIKIAQFLTSFAELIGGFGKLSNLQLAGVFAGLTLAMIGVYETIGAIVKWIQDPSWSNFAQVIQWLGVALTGVGVALVAINASNPLGWIVGGIGIVSGIAGWVGSWWGEQKKVTQELMSSEEATRKLKDAQDKLKIKTSEYSQASDRAKKARKNLIDTEKKNKISAEDLFREYQSGAKKYETMSDAEREVIDAYLENIDATSQLKKATHELQTEQYNMSKSTAQVSGAVYQEKKVFDEYFLTLVKGYENGKVSAKDMSTYTLNMMDNMDKETRKVFKENIPDSIRSAFDKNYARVFSDGTTQSYKEIYNGAKQTFGKDIPEIMKKTSFTMKVKTELDKQSANKVIADAKKIFGNSSGPMGSIIKLMEKKYLATGGIVNLPGRGVPIGATAYAGEAGREGVIPLTDSQAMSQLGYEIGRNVNINATVPVYVGNRQVAKEIRRIEAEDDFAFNR